MVLLPLLSRCVGIPPPPVSSSGGGGGRAGGGGGRAAAAAVPRARRGPAPSSRRQPGAGWNHAGRGGDSTGKGESAEPCGTAQDGSTDSPPARKAEPLRERPVGSSAARGRRARRLACSPLPRPARYVGSPRGTPAERNAPRRKAEGGGGKRQPRSPSRSRRSGSLQVRRARSRPDGPSSLPRAPPAAWYGPPRGTLGSLGRAARPWRRPGGERAPGVRAGRQRAARRRLAYRAAAAAGPGPPNCLWGLPGAWALSAAAPAAGPRHSRSWAQGRGRRRKSRHFA